MISRGPGPLAPPLGVIVNPSSAGGHSLVVWRKLGLTVPHHISSSEQDFRAKVREFSRRYKTIGVCGGDSSLTIAAEELLAVNFSGKLQFIPAGSVNDIILDIRENSESKATAAFLGNLVAGNAAKFFIGQANWGLGVVVNRWVGKTLHTLPFLRPLQNFIGTLSIIIAHLLRREQVTLSIKTGKEMVHGTYSVVLVSQIRHWASGLLFAPHASYLRPDFQIVTIRRCGLFRLIKIILAAKNAGHLGFLEVESRLAREIEIVSETAISVQIDGDILRDGVKEIRQREYRLHKKKSALRLSL